MVRIILRRVKGVVLAALVSVQPDEPLEVWEAQMDSPVPFWPAETVQ